MYIDTQTPDYLDQETGQSQFHEQMMRMELYGATPQRGETDHRYMPDEEQMIGLTEEMFTHIAYVMQNTQLEGDINDLLWNIVNIYHHKISRMERAFDQMNQQIRTLIRMQDGSEVKAHELETLTSESQQLANAIDFYDSIRAQSSQLYTQFTGECWIPAQGSRTQSEYAQTGAVLDAKQHLKAAKQKQQDALNPEGDKIVIAGGQDYQDHEKVYHMLDQTRAKHPEMVLVHGGMNKGVDHIASQWAANRNIHQIICKPDWSKGKRAGFLRNDQMIAMELIGAIIFPGSGLTENLADKLKAKKVPVKRCA